MLTVGKYHIVLFKFAVHSTSNFPDSQIIETRKKIGKNLLYILNLSADSSSTNLEYMFVGDGSSDYPHNLNPDNFTVYFKTNNKDSFWVSAIGLFVD